MIVEVATQAELDELGPNVIAVVRSGRFAAGGDREIRVCDSAKIEARDSTMIEAFDESQVIAYDTSEVKLYDSATVDIPNHVQIIDNRQTHK
ncbi:hypothetical protein EKI60_05900 [Candidatus Saccharibacteria bacterium]|nr:MAG: hypothetical protein EKI60_05900 [Candidatus Saccharibacteria bacterium]